MVNSKDVAKRAGVSHATASRAFSNPELLTEKTLKKVLDAAKELGYVPNSLASSLKSSQAGSAGFIISNIRNNFFTDIAYRLQRELYLDDKNFMVGLSDENADEELKCMLSQISHRVSAILFTPSAYSAEIESLIEHTKSVKFVQLFRNCYNNVDSLIVNDRKGSKMATDLFLKKNKRKILLLDGESELPTYRREGYFDAFEAIGITPDESFVKELPLQGDVEKDIDEFISELQPDGIIAVSDFLTAKTVEVLNRRELKIGKDIGVVAYDDSLIAKALQITAVGHNEEAIISGIKQMMRRAMDGHKDGDNIVIDPVIIERNSVL